MDFILRFQDISTEYKVINSKILHKLTKYNHRNRNCCSHTEKQYRKTSIYKVIKTKLWIGKHLLKGNMLYMLQKTKCCAFNFIAFFIN